MKYSVHFKKDEAVIAASITLQSTVAQWLGATGCLINDPAALCAHNSAQARV